MKKLTWQNPEQLFVAQELINKVKSKCCEIKENKKPLPLRPTFCGAQNGIYIFDPLYKIYCCLESVGIPQNIIGTYDQGVKWTDNFSLWKDRNTSTILPCNKCPYALMCGGGCAAKVMHINMRAPYCNKFPEILRANARRAYNQFINNY